MVQGWVYVGIALYLVWAPSTYPYYIMLLCSRGDDGDVQMKICRLYTARTDASPERHLTPSAPRPCHRHPTHQPSASPAKELPPMPNSASGGRGEAPSRGQINPSLGTRRIRANGRIHKAQNSGRPFPPGVTPTLTSRQHFHTKFNIQMSRLISRQEYPP